MEAEKRWDALGVGLVDGLGEIWCGPGWCRHRADAPAIEEEGGGGTGRSPWVARTIGSSMVRVEWAGAVFCEGGRMPEAGRPGDGVDCRLPDPIEPMTESCANALH